jgi:hypothetical protein
LFLEHDTKTSPQFDDQVFGKQLFRFTISPAGMNNINSRCNSFSLFIAIIITASAASVGNGQERYFYKEKDYGSEALYNPINLLLNGSYDIIQLDGHDRKIFSFPYSDATRNVLKNLGSPFGPISRYGWGNFIQDQIIPIHLTKKDAQWWPNYQLHLIGGGMTYTKMGEWYAAHQFPYPKLFSAATMATYHLLNEFVENGAYSGDNVDPIADVYVFDAGGMILFSFDNVNRFFSEDLNLADWSRQPTFMLNDGSLQNNGQYFSIKWKFPFSERWHFFYYFGMNGLTGLAYKMPDQSAISLGFGLRAKNLVLLDTSLHKETINTVWNAGIFYDRDNSLIASVFISGLTDDQLNINAYPGLFKIGPVSPGIWMIVRKDGNILGGVSTAWTPGIGFR